LSAKISPPGAPRAGADRSSVYAQYTVVPWNERDALQAALQQAGIPTAVHYPVPIHRQPAYAGFDNADCPVSDLLSQHVLSLPMGPYLSLADAEKVAATVLATTDE
jgi:UDP-2-acetamido-2-deoxy-ribo-hexuluronate aminotransferase